MFKGQKRTSSKSCIENWNIINCAVRSCKIKKFKNTEGFFLFIGMSFIALKLTIYNRYNFTSFNIPMEGSTNCIKSTAFTCKYKSITKCSNNKGSESPWISCNQQFFRSHNTYRICPFDFIHGFNHSFFNGICLQSIFCDYIGYYLTITCGMKD